MSAHNALSEHERLLKSLHNKEKRLVRQLAEVRALLVKVKQLGKLQVEEESCE